MARIRTIRPEIWESEKVGHLSIGAHLLFIGLISLADDEGRGRGDPAWLRNRIHAYRETPVDEVDRACREIEKTGLVGWYKPNGSTYYFIPGWKSNQYIEKPVASRFPVPPDQPNSPASPLPLPSNSPAPPLLIGEGPRSIGMEWNGMEGRGVPSIGVESKTETKTPPTQSNNKGAGKLIRSMDGSDVCCTRFDLWPEDGQRSSNRAPEPQPVATHGRRWVWDSSSLCWYAETLNDSRAWFCGFTSVEWARISFDRQKQIESEFGDDGEANRAHAIQLYYAEARRRDKIREDANGNTHGKTKPDSNRKFFK